MQVVAKDLIASKMASKDPCLPVFMPLYNLLHSCVGDLLCFYQREY